MQKPFLLVYRFPCDLKLCFKPPHLIREFHARTRYHSLRFVITTTQHFFFLFIRGVDPNIILKCLPGYSNAKLYLYPLN
ncbi:hypothetical protein DET50_1208 [Marinobacter pelagius]|uniref:Uncharacterized protein n=1 Tax=Marinobacter pelagius TaxID=379482 RepID=A0A366GIQ3_9GAMM|nr:hypothetical protein DET50_1208 [Marinobacter pelagius]